jgi:CRISPR type I-E-associated protein CasB/Cse2
MTDRSTVVRGIVAEICAQGYGTGPLADLRRFDPNEIASAPPALHRLLARHVEDESWLYGDGLARWALLVHCLALAAPDGIRANQKLGAALFEASFNEGRLTKLLKADEAALPVVAPRVVRFLVAARKQLPAAELADLILDGSDAARLRIARDYYRAESNKAAKQAA